MSQDIGTLLHIMIVALSLFLLHWLLRFLLWEQYAAFIQIFFRHPFDQLLWHTVPLEQVKSQKSGLTAHHTVKNSWPSRTKLTLVIYIRSPWKLSASVAGFAIVTEGWDYQKNIYLKLTLYSYTETWPFSKLKHLWKIELERDIKINYPTPKKKKRKEKMEKKKEEEAKLIKPPLLIWLVNLNGLPRLFPDFYKQTIRALGTCLQ